jgi:hypothetical protein
MPSRTNKIVGSPHGINDSGLFAYYDTAKLWLKCGRSVELLEEGFSKLPRIASDLKGAEQARRANQRSLARLDGVAVCYFVGFHDGT